MFKISILFLVLILISSSSTPVPKLQSFRELGAYHCKVTNLPLLYRITSGGLAQEYGPSFKQYDAYIRSFVGPDFYYRQDERDEDEEQQNPYKQDEIVSEYVKGINDCGLDWSQKQVYQIWRYIRFMLNSDYLFEWLRAKMRISYGYEIQKPNAWMDGQQRQQRLRLQKLYSNQYLYSLEDLMHRDYLFPILTTLRKNIAIAASGTYTKSGKPLLVNIWQTRNYPTDLFFPVEINIDGEDFFSFTIPGLPLLLSGSSKNVAWAFSGILIDRTNVEQIETTGMRFFDEDNERWVKIKKVEDSIKVKGKEDHNVTYYWSKEGPLISKSESKSKIREFIVKWHENEPRVRVLFSELVTLLKNPTLRPVLYFPFNSLLLVDNKGIHHHICPPKFPYYFLYPDMLGQPQNFQNKQLWASNPKRGFFAVSNTRLSSTKPFGYLDREVFNSDQQSLANLLKQLKQNKKDLFQILQSVISNCQTSNAKKIVDNLVTIYRKAKFTYLPDDTIRNQNDQLVAMLDKWDHKITHPKLGSIYRLWLYFLKMNTFGHSARSEFAKDLARFKLSTDTYFAGQTQLWKGVASYGECNIDQYNDKIEIHVNHTGHNSSCYYNILKSINQTRLFFIEEGKGLLNTESGLYNEKKTWNPLREKYFKKVKDADTAFLNTFKEKLVIGVELGAGVVYSNDGVGGLKAFEFGEGKKWTEEDYSRYKEEQFEKQEQYEQEVQQEIVEEKLTQKQQEQEEKPKETEENQDKDKVVENKNDEVVKQNQEEFKPQQDGEL